VGEDSIFEGGIGGDGPPADGSDGGDGDPDDEYQDFDGQGSAQPFGEGRPFVESAAVDLFGLPCSPYEVVLKPIGRLVAVCDVHLFVAEHLD